MVFLLFLLTTISCQINSEDSSAMVVAYWEKGEVQSYRISTVSVGIMYGDTSYADTTVVSVDVSVLEASRRGYILNWFYHDFEHSSDDQWQDKQTALFPDLNIQIRTDELGKFVEVVNWKQLRDSIMVFASTMRSNLKDAPNIEKIAANLESIYSSKKSIEASAINEILQFYTFHGLKYTIGKEYGYTKKVPNRFGGKPFDSEVVCWIDAIDEEKDFAVYGMRQLVDTIQLKEATIKNIEKMDPEYTEYMLPKEEYPAIIDETWGAAKINGDGWPLYSKMLNEVNTGIVILVKECIIEME